MCIFFIKIMLDITKLYKTMIIVILPYELRKNDDISYHLEEMRVLPRMFIQVDFKNEKKNKKASDLLDNEIILINNKKYIIISRI